MCPRARAVNNIGLSYDDSKYCCHRLREAMSMMRYCDWWPTGTIMILSEAMREPLLPWTFCVGVELSGKVIYEGST